MLLKPLLMPRNRNKKMQPDMSRDCWVNYGNGEAKYYSTVTDALAYIESIDTLNLQPIILYDASTMRNITWILKK